MPRSEDRRSRRHPSLRLRRGFKPSRPTVLAALSIMVAVAGCSTGSPFLAVFEPDEDKIFGEPSVYRDPDAPELAYGSEEYRDKTPLSQYDGADEIVNGKCIPDQPVSYCATIEGLFKQPVGYPSGYARKQFLRGNRVFNANWVPAPRDDNRKRDGLGPVFDARGCAACHKGNGRGKLPNEAEGDLGTLVLRISLGEAGPQDPPPPHPVYGSQLNYRGIAGVAPEGRIRVSYEDIEGRFPDGEAFTLRKPSYSIDGPNYGPIDAALATSPRLPPPVIGLGLVEGVPETDLLARADPEDRDGDGISGRANYAPDPEDGRIKLGRYGWKAGAVSLRQQTAGALLGDMGITSSVFPEANCTAAQEACARQPRGGDPEISDADLDALVFYMQMLSPTGRRNGNDPAVLEGSDLFETAGCAACHTPQMKSREHPEAGTLSNLVFHPYSDFLLHDMGEGLADNRAEFLADGREWRTPPLWGLGLTEEVNGNTYYLHDGRARSLQEAILWHGGEAERSRQAFVKMPKAERAALISFLESL